MMFAVIISLLVSQRLQRDSVYALGLARKGIRLQRGRDIDVMESLQVSDVMFDEKVTLAVGFPVARLADMVMQTAGTLLRCWTTPASCLGWLPSKTIEAGAACVGKSLSAVAWPHACILVTLRRGRQVLFPHGDTLLKAGDALVYVAENEAREAVRRLCQSPVDEQGE
jgi:hypothetical protein